MALQQRFGYGLLALAVGNLTLAAGGRLSGALDVTTTLVLGNFALTLFVLSALQIREVSPFEMEGRHRRLVSGIATALVVGGVGLFAAGVLLAADAVLS